MARVALKELPCVQEDAHGVLRVAGSRVPLAAVVDHFKAGISPEAIVADYPTLSLADVYASIGYYLRHREALDRALNAEELMLEELSAPFRTAQSSAYPTFLALLKARSQG